MPSVSPNGNGPGTASEGIIVFQSSSVTGTLQRVDSKDAARKKRAHYKSRRGCIECKRRRVKCNEQFPCSNCVKRGTQCVRAALPEERAMSQVQRVTSNVPCEMSPMGPLSPNARINLLHLRLFHHFQNVTVPTLSMQQLWPGVMQLALHEEYVMSTVLSVAATHLSSLNPHDSAQAVASMQMLSKALYLLRQVLAQEVIDGNCVARAGATLMLNYILWNNLSFLPDAARRGAALMHVDSDSSSDEDRPLSGPLTDNFRLDLSQDMLFPLSPGVLHVFFEGLPILLKRHSIFIEMARHRPRIDIETSLRQRGIDPARYVQPFLRMFEDPRFISTPSGDDSPAGLPGSSPDYSTTPGTLPRSWKYYVELEAHLAWRQIQTQYPDLAAQVVVPEILQRQNPDLDAALDVLMADRRISFTTKPSSPEIVEQGLRNMLTMRSTFERTVRRLSPILCCLPDDSYTGSYAAGSFDPTQWTDNEPSLAEIHASDLQRLLFVIPILCYGPFLELIMTNDSRALVFLYHFYRATRILLSPEAKESWWATDRSRVMERLLGDELARRGLSPDLGQWMDAEEADGSEMGDINSGWDFEEKERLMEQRQEFEQGDDRQVCCRQWYLIAQVNAKIGGGEKRTRWAECS